MSKIRSKSGRKRRAQALWSAALCASALCAAESVEAQAAAPEPTPEPAAPAVSVEATATVPSAPAEPALVAPVEVVAPPPLVSAPAPEAPPPPVAAAPAATSSWSPVYSGSYFTRYEMRANYDDMGVSRGRFLEGDAVFYRARFGIGTGLIDVGKDLKVALQFTPQVAGVMGALTVNGAPSTIVDAQVGLHEGYARVQGDHVRFDTGRFELNYGDSLVIGNLDWNEVARSFDGARARISPTPNGAWIDLFATMVDEGRDPALATPPGNPGAKGMGFGDGDAYFYGAYMGLGPKITQGLDLDLYLLGSSWHEQKNIKLVDPTNSANVGMYKRGEAHQLTAGARIKQKVKFVDYRAEGGVQAGSRLGALPKFDAAGMPTSDVQKSVNVGAYQIDAELGLNMFADKFRVGAEGLYASGDKTKTKDKNEGWDELYPTSHKWLGLADVLNQGGVKRTNVTSGVLHLTLKPVKDFSMQADGHLFMRPQDSVTPTGKLVKAGRAGGEVDIQAGYKLGKGLNVRALYAVFLPDKNYYPAPSTVGTIAPIHYGELELRYDL